MRNEGIARKYIGHRLLGGRVPQQAKRDDFGGEAVMREYPLVF